jgi:tetratricopeptide (TPR) repeat protein
MQLNPINLSSLNPKIHPTRRIAPVMALHALLALAFFGQAFMAAPPAQAAGKRADRREVEARQAFAAGKYQDALDLYAQLYADKVHPTYLRNIGRCYQNLRLPDKAINAFRDYLRQAKDIAPGERSEIDGYIAEMEVMKKQQEEDAQAGAAAAQPPTPPLPTRPMVASLDPNASQSNALRLSNATPEPVPQPTPFYKKGWFWGVVGVAVVGGVVGGLYAAGTFSKSSIGCSASAGCY